LYEARHSLNTPPSALRRETSGPLINVIYTDCQREDPCTSLSAATHRLHKD